MERYAKSWCDSWGHTFYKLEELESWQQKVGKIYFFNTIKNRPDNAIIKYFIGFMSWWVGEDFTLPDREYKMMQIMDSFEIPIPKLLSDLNVGDEKYIIMEYIKGIELSKALRYNPNLIIPTTKIILDIHQKLIGYYKKDFPHISLRIVLLNLLYMVSELSPGPIKMDYEEKIHDLINQETNVTYSTNPVIIHGDLHLENILVDTENNNAIHIIDWEDCIIGDYRFDVANFYKCLRKGYNQTLANQFLEEYQKRSGYVCDNDDIEYWASILDLRDEIIAKWFAHKIKNNLPVPKTTLKWIREEKIES